MSPKTKEQFEEIRKRSRTTILQTAMELFAHNGFHSTTITQIAKEAGISKGLLYNYFKNKKDLLKQIIMEAMAIGDGLMAKLMEVPDQPKKQLKIIISESFDMVEANPHYWKLLTSLAFQTDALEEFENIFTNKTTQWIGMIEELFKKIGYKKPKKEAYMYAAVMDGIFIHFLQLQEAYPLKEMKAFIIKKYCE